MRRSRRSPAHQAVSNQLDPRPRHARPAFGGARAFSWLHRGFRMGFQMAFQMAFRLAFSWLRVGLLVSHERVVLMSRSAGYRTLRPALERFGASDHD
jgi:hypothetical protein